MNSIDLVPFADGRQRPYAATAACGGIVFACGQVPSRPDGSVPADIADQVHQALDNLEEALKRASSDLSRLLRLTVYLADLDEFDEYNAAYLTRLAGHPLPPRTTIEVARFLGAKRVEIDAVAATTT